MRTKLIVLLLALAALLTLATLASAATNAVSLPWWTMDGGGGTSQGGDYSLSGTIGQSDAGPSLTGGEFSLQGGFWGAARSAAPPETSGSAIYLPLLSR